MIINLFRFKSISQLFKADIINVLLIFGVWVAMVILVNPIGDFPLNDDWAYGRAVQSVVEKGDFQLSGWTATNLFSQVFWGALFCLPFGFSFTALRFSTLTLGLIGILSTYGLLRELNQNYKISLLGALLVVSSNLPNSYGNQIVATTNNSNWNLGYGAISIALILMLLYGVFTIGATHDYLSWNRVRWQALHNLMQENQISPNHINGGFEFNGWYLYDSKYKYKPEKTWQWFDRDDYIVSFKLVTGYEEVKRYPFRRWLPWGEGNIFLLKKY
jgi:hypothetical protein